MKWFLTRKVAFNTWCIYLFKNKVQWNHIISIITIYQYLHYLPIKGLQADENMRVLSGPKHIKLFIFSGVLWETEKLQFRNIILWGKNRKNNKITSSIFQSFIYNWCLQFWTLSFYMWTTALVIATFLLLVIDLLK